MAIEVDMYLLLHECILGFTIPYAHSYSSCPDHRKSKRKTAEGLMTALRQIINFYVSYGWSIIYIVFDGERAMNMPMFLEFIWSTSARPISLAHGDHCQRVERRQGVIKVRSKNSLCSL